jgi:hypothetical protein
MRLKAEITRLTDVRFGAHHGSESLFGKTDDEEDHESGSFLSSVRRCSMSRLDAGCWEIGAELPLYCGADRDGIVVVAISTVGSREPVRIDTSRCLRRETTRPWFEQSNRWQTNEIGGSGDRDMST